MEYYESTCTNPDCKHRWQWVGYKTGIGKTPTQLEQMRRVGKTCPSCGHAAGVSLDHTSPGAQALDEAFEGLADAIAGKGRSE